MLNSALSFLKSLNFVMKTLTRNQYSATTRMKNKSVILINIFSRYFIKKFRCFRIKCILYHIPEERCPEENRKRKAVCNKRTRSLVCALHLHGKRAASFLTLPSTYLAHFFFSLRLVDRFLYASEGTLP